MKGIYWIRNDDPSKLAIVARPRGNEWLETDLDRLKIGGIEGIVSLLTTPEAEILGLVDESAVAARLGISFFSFPIPDRRVPENTDAFSEFVAGIAAEVKSGRAIGIHCWGSIGRSTVAAASLLVHLGWNADAALDEIEVARGCPVPDTREQRAWILTLRPPHPAR